MQSTVSVIIIKKNIYIVSLCQMYYKFNKAPEAAEPEEDGIKDEEASKLKRKSVAAKEMS